MSKKFNRVTQGPFTLEHLRPPDPAAGAEFVHIFEDGYTSRILSLRLTVTNDGLGAPLIVGLHHYHGDLDSLFVASTVGQAINTVWTHFFLPNILSVDLSLTRQLVITRLPGNYLVIGSDRLETDILNLGGGDQISNILLYLQKWPILEE